MSLQPVPLNEDMSVKGGWMQAVWRGWFTALYALVKPLGGNGTTANRPTTGLYVGLQYFDATLGLPVFVRTIGPPAVWVNGAGAVV